MKFPKRLVDIALARVVINHDGEATNPARAAHQGIMAEVAYIRDDGWTLGAPAALEDVAESLWSDQWVASYRLDDEGTWTKQWARASVPQHKEIEIRQMEVGDSGPF